MSTIKRFFLVDCLGALISTFLLGFVLVRFQSFFGMPVSTLYLLAGIAACFAVYSGLGYLVTNMQKPIYLRTIAVANLLYCLLTLTLVYVHREVITLWGVAYFVGEVAIVVFLATREWKQAPDLPY